MTRILSVFKLLKRVGFALLVLGETPFAQEVIWVRNGDNSNSRFGSSMISLGDQNGDGFTDWAVSSPGSNQSATDDKRDFFYGGNPPSHEPYMTFHSRPGTDYYICSIMQSIGDFDGDGIDDWALGWWSQPIDSLYWEFFRGGQGNDTIPVATLVTFSHRDGAWMASIGDHNGDGYDDFYYFTGEDDDRGLLYLGAADWNLDVDLTNSSVPRGSGKVKSYSDWSGDINGDGYSDFMTSGYYDDTTYFYFGGPSPDTIPEIITPTRYTSRANMSIDLNGDGATDLIRGGVGTLFVSYGGEDFSPEATYQLQFPGCNQAIEFVKPAGDFNLDGIPDLVALSNYCSDHWGMFAVYLGATWPNPNPSLIGEGFWYWPFDWVQLFFGIGLGDVNGDGIDDIAISCAGTMLDSQRGRVVILAGDSSLHVAADYHPEFPGELRLSAFPNPFNSTLSISLDAPLHQDVSVLLYDLLGREVDVVFRGRVGSNTISYAVPAGMASGVYFLRASAGEQAEIRKVVLLK